MLLRIKVLTLLLLCLSGAVTMQAEMKTDSLCHRSVGMTVSQIGASVVLNAAITEGLKYSIHRERPNGYDDNSFPSRHTSWAFTASTVLSNEFYRSAPWVSVAAQTAASVVGVQRVASGWHYASDVIAGAGVGIASTELAYVLGRVVFKRKFNYTPVDVVELESKLEVFSTTTALITLNEECMVGISADAGVLVPLNEKFACTGSLYYLSLPYTFTSSGVKGGFSYRHILRGPFELETAAGGGIGYRTSHYGYSGLAGTGFVNIGSARYLTERFAVTASVGYQYLKFSESWNCLTISFGSRARF